MTKIEPPTMGTVRNYRETPLVRNYKIIPQFRSLHPVTITRKVEFAPVSYKIAKIAPRRR